MKPKVILEAEFFSAFVTKANSHSIPGRTNPNYQNAVEINNRINQIEEILIAGDVKTNIKESHFLKVIKKEQKIGQKDWDTYDELLLYKLFKNGCICTENLEQCGKDSKAIYLASKKEIEVLETENNFGVIIKGIEYDYMNFYESSDFFRKINGDFYKEPNWMPPTRNIVIIDPYLFNNSQNDDKLTRLISMVSNYKQNQPLSLLIITSNKDGYNYEGKFERLKLELKIPICIVAPEKIQLFNTKTRDRSIITDNCLITIGHPFEADPTDISSRFLYSGNNFTIQQKCNDWNIILQEIKKFANKTPVNLDSFKQKFITEDFICELL
jgi:hypothetical protein